MFCFVRIIGHLTLAFFQALVLVYEILRKAKDDPDYGPLVVVGTASVGSSSKMVNKVPCMMSYLHRSSIHPSKQAIGSGESESK